jgi:thioredoxin-dependent peroxiredoxin
MNNTGEIAMRLTKPQPAPALPLSDLNGEPIAIDAGRRLLLSIFREASCPFCNFRVYELTHNFRDLRELGLDVVVVFASDEQDVRRFIAKQPRPFRIVADPYRRAHTSYGVERSKFGKLRALLTRFPAMIRGMVEMRFGGGRSGDLLPADFLIDADGRIAETYYGRDAGDHIPMERIELFAARGLATKRNASSGPWPST